MNLNIIQNIGIGRLPGHTMNFTLSMILLFTVHLVHPLELPAQETLKNPTIKINSIHEYDVPPICTTSKYGSTGLDSYVYPEEGRVIDHPNKLLGSTSLFQTKKNNPGTSESNNAPMNEFTSHDDMGSIKWINEPKKESSITFPLEGHSMTWSQMWDASFPNSNSMQSIPWEPSDSSILLSSTSIESNPQVPEYDYTSHTPGELLHQNTQSFENKSEARHISGDRVNDLIMKAFPNYNQLDSSNIFGTKSFEQTPHVPDGTFMRHSSIPTLQQHSDSHTHAPISSKNEILQDVDWAFWNPQYPDSLSVPPEVCHKLIVESDGLGINESGIDSTWLTSSILNNTPSRCASMPSHEGSSPLPEGFNMHCFTNHNEPFSDPRSPDYLTSATGAPGFSDQCGYQIHASPLLESQIAQKGDSEIEIPQYKSKLGDPYEKIDHRPNELHISKENYNSGGTEPSYLVVPNITPRDSENLLSSELELSTDMSDHSFSHAPNYDPPSSANRILNDGPKDLNKMLTPKDGSGIPQYIDGQQESSALLHDHFDGSQGFGDQTNGRVNEGSGSLIPSTNHLDSVYTSSSKHSSLNMENDHVPQDPLHHQMVGDELNYPHNKNDVGAAQLGESSNFMTTSHNSRDSYMNHLNLLELQGESSLKSVQSPNSLKRKASKVFEIRSDRNTKTLSMKERKTHSADTSYESRMMTFINMHNHGFSLPKGTKSTHMVSLIQDVGMKSLESEGLWSQYQIWFDKWREQMVKSICTAEALGLLNDVNQKYMLKAVGMVDKGMVMGFLGLLILIESQIKVNSVGSNILDEGLGFIQNFLGDMPSLVLNKLPPLMKIKKLNIDIASNPLELFVSLTLIQRRRDVKVQLYHNIWSNWKSEKAPSTPYVSISLFHKVLYRITLLDSTPTNISFSISKKNLGKVKALTNAEFYKIRCGIVDKGRQSMYLFKSIFLNKTAFFKSLEADLLTKLAIEKKKMTHEDYIQYSSLLINAIKVVEKTVVEGFFGVVKYLHEESNLELNLEALQENAWGFLQHHFSSWKSIPLENLFLEIDTSRAEKQQKLNPDLEFAVESFHIVMRASSKNPMSQKLVQSLLRNWIGSLDTNQKHVKSFQDLFISKDQTPFIHWFKF
ncbi:hypothetical protein DFH28DRAFT_1056103 [Melampsora americana]|nr:hypothetical protein DFH28DRAFT_1056103 [Melampsora americana]